MVNVLTFKNDGHHVINAKSFFSFYWSCVDVTEAKASITCTEQFFKHMCRITQI